jgi:hypothetical protein
LADDVDTTLFTALGGAYAGLRLIKKQTIGTGVSSVAVTNAFSAIYENYKIIVSGGVASANTGFNLKLGSTVTGYYGGIAAVTYSSGAVAGGSDSNQSSFRYQGDADTTTISYAVDVFSPYLAKKTTIQANKTSFNTAGYAGTYNGFLNNTTSYTDFTFIVEGGGVTITGGTIYIYGYGIS